MVPKLLLLFTTEGWSSQPYSINFGKHAFLFGPAEIRSAHFVVVYFFVAAVKRADLLSFE